MTGIIIPQMARFYRISTNGQTYTFNLEASRANSFRGGLLIQQCYNNPAMWLITTEVAGQNNVSYHKISISGGSDLGITSATISETTLTINFNGTAWGGVTLIWFD